MSVWTRLFGHRQYRQFVVICHPRTGSNLLGSYLKSHPNIKMHGEIFNKLNGRSIDDIYKVFRKNKPRKIKASGFKLFYTHPDDGDNEEILRLIEKIPHAIIIHLTRNDKLRTLVSWKIAIETNVWGLKQSESLIPVEEKKVNIAPEEAIQFLENITYYEQRITQRFKEKNFVNIIYEDLVNSPEESLQKIIAALGLTYQPLSNIYRRSNPEDLNKLISNYQELWEQGVLEKFKL